ncbi:MAG: hypothetical protein HY705_07770 [Gemmatimonadetes bacterium]|nr:hypothetical protein [Gemmatimonadota bacterium]
MRSSSARSPLATLAVLLPAVAHAAAAQIPAVRITGRIQTQFTAVSGDSTSSFTPDTVVTSSFEVRRFRFQADVQIGDDITMVLQPTFEMGALGMRDAWLRVGFARHFGLTVGQEKKPFNRYELNSSINLPSIERGARFRGFARAVAQNNLLEENGYIRHDIGASLDGSFAAGRVRVKVGVYNGTGESAADVNDAKTYAARATGTVLEDAERRPRLRLGAAFVARDRAVTRTASSTTFWPDSARRTAAVAIDAEWGDFRPGLHVIVDVATGDHLGPSAARYDTGRNFGNLRPNTLGAAFSRFRSLQIIGAYRVAVRAVAGARLVEFVEPAVRLDLTDPDTDKDGDAGTLLTPVLNLHFSETALLRAGLDLYRYRDAVGADRSLRVVRFSWQASF